MFLLRKIPTEHRWQRVWTTCNDCICISFNANRATGAIETSECIASVGHALRYTKSCGIDSIDDCGHSQWWGRFEDTSWCGRQSKHWSAIDRSRYGMHECNSSRNTALDGPHVCRLPRQLCGSPSIVATRYVRITLFQLELRHENMHSKIGFASHLTIATI